MNRAGRRAARRRRTAPPLDETRVLARFLDLVAQQNAAPDRVLVSCEDCDRAEWMTHEQLAHLQARFPNGSGGCLWDVL